MPVYVYQCDTCGLAFERRQRMSEAPLVDCPECDGHVHRVIQPVGVVFKGSGFYVTDNRSHSSTALPGKKETDTVKEEKTADKKSDSADSSASTSD
jgi:putative FmdB family regulatory protein